MILKRWSICSGSRPTSAESAAALAKKYAEDGQGCRVTETLLMTSIRRRCASQKFFYLCKAFTVGYPTVFVRLPAVRCAANIATAPTRSVAVKSRPCPTYWRSSQLCEPRHRYWRRTLSSARCLHDSACGSPICGVFGNQRRALVDQVDPRVVKVLDIKTPDSSEVHRILGTTSHLQPHDQIKFVVCSRGDYDWARIKCDQYQLFDRVADVLFSPSWALEPSELADWIVADRLPARMQMQLQLLGAMCPDVDEQRISSDPS